MKLQNYVYQCDNCKNKFTAPELPGEPYGEFLLRTKNDEMAYLFAIESKEFHEVSQIVKEGLRITDISQLGKAKVLHQLFGIACDLSESGEEYKIGGHPLCPKCGSNDMFSWEPVLEIVEIDVKNVTHDRWNKLTYEDKKAEIERALPRILSEKEKLGII